MDPTQPAVPPPAPSFPPAAAWPPADPALAPGAWAPGQPVVPPYPHSLNPSVPVADPDRRRRLLTGLLGIAGGFVVLSVVTGQLPLALSGVASVPVSATILMLAQLLFGVAVVAAAFLLSPGSPAGKGIGIGVFVVVLVLVLALQTIRMTTSVPPVVNAVLFNAPAALVLAGAVGWLLACGVRRGAFLGLLAALIPFLPIGWGMVMAGIEAPLTTLVVQTVALVAAGIVLAVGVVKGR